MPLKPPRPRDPAPPDTSFVRISGTPRPPPALAPPPPPVRVPPRASPSPPPGSRPFARFAKGATTMLARRKVTEQNKVGVALFLGAVLAIAILALIPLLIYVL